MIILFLIYRKNVPKSVQTLPTFTEMGISDKFVIRCVWGVWHSIWRQGVNHVWSYLCPGLTKDFGQFPIVEEIRFKKITMQR